MESGRICVANVTDSPTCSLNQAAVDGRALEMSTPERLQVYLQAHTLNFQRFRLTLAVKNVTIGAAWQESDVDPHHS